MKIIINGSIMTPIYEQIADQIKCMIRKGELRENDSLPSVRALTVKKAYDALESEGFTATIHGKGTYVTAANKDLLLEEQRKEIERSLEQTIAKARRSGISDEEIKTMIHLLLEG